MPGFNLNDDEMWLIPTLRSLTTTQQEIVYMLVRQMSTRNNGSSVALVSSIVPFELQAITRSKSRRPPEK